MIAMAAMTWYAAPWMPWSTPVRISAGMASEASASAVSSSRPRTSSTRNGRSSRLSEKA